jgi:hypothetical protein
MRGRLARSLAAIGLTLGVFGIGVVGSAPPAGALPPPEFYCGAFKPHTSDIVSTSALILIGPGFVKFGCVAFHQPMAGQYVFHCYYVYHEDGFDPADPSDDNIYWVPLSGC